MARFSGPWRTNALRFEQDNSVHRPIACEISVIMCSSGCASERRLNITAGPGAELTAAQYYAASPPLLACASFSCQWKAYTCTFFYPRSQRAIAEGPGTCIHMMTRRWAAARHCALCRAALRNEDSAQLGCGIELVASVFPVGVFFGLFLSHVSPDLSWDSDQGSYRQQRPLEPLASLGPQSFYQPPPYPGCFSLAWPRPNPVSWVGRTAAE